MIRRCSAQAIDPFIELTSLLCSWSVSYTHLANIIVGATFDESLKGTIRVSVVATGVEISAANNVRLSMLSRALASPEIPVPVQRP